MIVYTKTGCPWCKGVLDYLKENNIPFEERNVLENPEYFKEMKEISGQDKTPTIDIDGEILADSDREELDQFLNGN